MSNQGEKQGNPLRVSAIVCEEDAPPATRVVVGERVIELLTERVYDQVINDVRRGQLATVSD